MEELDDATRHNLLMASTIALLPFVELATAQFKIPTVATFSYLGLGLFRGIPEGDEDADTIDYGTLLAMLACQYPEDAVVIDYVLRCLAAKAFTIDSLVSSVKDTIEFIKENTSALL